MSQYCVDLNIFTNCTKNFSNNASLITNTFNSFVDTFSLDLINNIRVFVDPQPKDCNLNNYIEQIKKNIPYDEIIITNGLADGYIKSINICESDYLFQLEHDWIFTKNIKHSLNDIMSLIVGIDSEHFRFNKRSNVVHGEDVLVERSYDGMKYCKTPIRSNNPHIINRKSYIDKWNAHINLNNILNGSNGIENNLKNTGGFVYGPMHMSQSIIHTDGKS